MEAEQTTVLSTRVTHAFARLVKEYLRRDAHVNTGDFLRDAAREKIERDAPDLYRHALSSRAERRTHGGKVAR